MDGVQILNEIPVYVIEWSWTTFFLAFGITLIGVLFSMLGAIGDCIDGGLIATLVIIGVVFGIIIGGCTCVTETDEIDCIKYQVIIDDSVSMNEFYDKYEVLDQEGLIFTVREKE